MATTTTQQTVSPAEALWALYSAQTKRVRKAFRTRLLAEEGIVQAQKNVVKQSLVRVFDELKNGKTRHDARNLFAD